jgi:NADPH:quinone reductase-like Zn-dependent oxidoreductase
MKLRYKIAIGCLAVLIVAVSSLAIVLSHTTDCPEMPATSAGTETMKAVRSYCYGAPEVLSYGDADRPTPGEGELLVRVEAAGVNPLDYHYMRGSPYVIRLFAGIGAPEDPAVGVDFAGTVAAIGPGVTEFKVGDEVFGGANGAFAQYLVVRENRAVVKKPESISFADVAGVPIAGVTAIQALRDHGELQSGQRVLINGASGGVGTYAVQIAKAMGAHVTGVCSGRNVDMVRSIGADEVINYKEADYTEGGQTYDLIVDMVGNHSPLDNAELLTPEGKLVIVGGPKGNWIAPLKSPIMAAISNIFVDQELMTFTARLLQDDLAALADYMAAGEVTTVIDQRFPLAATDEAVAYSETGRTRGKIIIDVAQPETVATH